MPPTNDDLRAACSTAGQRPEVTLRGILARADQENRRVVALHVGRAVWDSLRQLAMVTALGPTIAGDAMFCGVPVYVNDEMPPSLVFPEVDQPWGSPSLDPAFVAAEARLFADAARWRA